QLRLWADERLRSASHGPPNAFDLYFFFLAGPFRVLPGVSKCGRAAVAEELEWMGWSLEDVGRCGDELVAKGLALIDWRQKLVFLTGAYKQAENCPCSGPQTVNWRRKVIDLPDGEIK